jgi:hypothetical protein
MPAQVSPLFGLVVGVPEDAFAIPRPFRRAHSGQARHLGVLDALDALRKVDLGDTTRPAYDPPVPTSPWASRYRHKTFRRCENISATQSGFAPCRHKLTSPSTQSL